jgi:hypothetical protein
MSHELEPKVGRWYRRLDDEEMFKVIAIDEDDGLIEIKTPDGEVEELDAMEWVELDLEATTAPEDYIEPDEEDDEVEVAKDVDEDARPARGRGARARDDDEDEDDDDWEDVDDDDDDNEDGYDDR